MTLGELIKEYRNKYNLSMDAFSEKSGISKAYISLLEKNKHPKTGKPIAPSIQCIKQAARGLDMDFNDLFNVLDCDVSLEDSKQEILFDSKLENTIGTEQKTKEAHEILSEIMKERNLKVAEVARLCNLPDGTVRGIIKREQKDIALKVALKLSKGLGISIECLNGMEEPTEDKEKSYHETHATEKEFENIVKKYRDLDPHGKKMVDFTLNEEWERSKALANQAEERVPEYNTRLINYYYRLASAGTGQIIFDMPPTKRIEIPNIAKYKKVDYAIGVNGDSMEPLYHDGDILLVEMTEDIQIGDIGIFRVNGESYVKKLGEAELISLNPDAKNIPLNESAGRMGKVIDKLPND